MLSACIDNDLSSIWSDLIMTLKLMLVFQSRKRQQILQQALEVSDYQSVACVALDTDLQQTLQAAQAIVMIFAIKW